MKQYISLLLASTLLTACGVDDKSEAERKAEQGITSDGETDEAPVISGDQSQNHPIVNKATDAAVDYKARVKLLMNNKLYVANFLGSLLDATKETFVPDDPYLSNKTADELLAPRLPSLAGKINRFRILIHRTVDNIVSKALLGQKDHSKILESTRFFVKGNAIGKRKDEVYEVSGYDTYNTAQLMQLKGSGALYDSFEYQYATNSGGILITTPITTEQFQHLETTLYDSIVATLRKSFKGYKLDAHQKIEVDADGNPIIVDMDPFAGLFDFLDAPSATALSAGTIASLSGGLSRATRVGSGGVDLRSFSMNGNQGTQLDLGLPLFVQLKGSVDGGKSTDTTTGSVAYRLGNTVIGAIQAYANSGESFGLDGHQLETSVVASHSFGGFFVEGQLGAVSANNVHAADWSGFRSQVTLGVDTQFVSPFIQVAHRQLDRNHTYALNDTAAYVGLDVEVAGLTTDAYRIDTRLLTKVGVGSKDWTHGSKAVGSTTGFEGSVEWSGSLTLNSGVSFSTNLTLGSTTESSASFTVSVTQ